MSENTDANFLNEKHIENTYAQLLIVFVIVVFLLLNYY